MKKKAVFLDRDGNINRDVGYPNSFDSVHIYPYSFEAVRRINAAGLLAVVVTNQSGIARGLILETQLKALHDSMINEFKEHGARLDGIYYCPHFPYSLEPQYKQNCQCRKPFPDMGLAAARDLNIDLDGSYMIGDKVEDILFGLNLGVKPILVLTGYGRSSRSRLKKEKIVPAHVSDNLLDAVNWLLDQEASRAARKPGGREK